MVIHKKIYGEIVELEFIKVKNYENFNQYQVYKKVNNERVPLYIENFTDLQIREIANNRNILEDEVVYCDVCS